MSHPNRESTWEYFLSIDEDLGQCARYVEFSPKNYSTFSVEFARIIMASGSEFDSIAKKLCQAISPDKSPQSILDYHPIITGKYPRFKDCTVTIPRFNLEVQPWKGWNGTSAPNWWKAFNKTKHEREKYFEAACLEKCLVSLFGIDDRAHVFVSGPGSTPS